MNLDKHQACCHCGANLDLRVGVWVTPGDEHVETGNIDWEGAIDAAKDSKNWWCPTCCDHTGFPIEEGETIEGVVDKLIDRPTPPSTDEMWEALLLIKTIAKHGEGSKGGE